MTKTSAIIWDGTPDSAEAVINYFEKSNNIKVNLDNTGLTYLSFKTAFGKSIIRVKDCPVYIVEHRPGVFMTMTHNEYIDFLEEDVHD